jgi:hypothetical protein
MINNKKKQLTKQEFFKFGVPSGGERTFTLNIDKPCEVYFFCNSETGVPAGSNRTATINNSFILNGYNTPVATRLYPYELRLRCNLNEVDNTIYTIKITQPLTVTVICRYYEDAL